MSQLSLSGYSTFAFGVETKVYKNWNGEFRFYTNNILDDTEMEVQIYYGFSPKKYHQIRLGAGFNGNAIQGEANSLQIPLQLIIFPLQQTKNLAITVELAPQWFIHDPIGTDNVVLRNLWAIRYTFGGD